MATYWFDEISYMGEYGERMGAAGDPTLAIAGLDGKIDSVKDGKRTIFPNLWTASGCKYNLLHYELHERGALFMRGTTDELLQAVETDQQRGFERIAVINANYLQICYIGQAVGPNKTPSSIIGIAGKDTYWSPKVLALSEESARSGQKWELIAEIGGKEHFTRKPTPKIIIYSFVLLEELKQIIGRKRRVVPWF